MYSSNTDFLFNQILLSLASDKWKVILSQVVRNCFVCCHCIPTQCLYQYCMYLSNYNTHAVKCSQACDDFCSSKSNSSTLDLQETHVSLTLAPSHHQTMWGFKWTYLSKKEDSKFIFHNFHNFYIFFIT